jgi:hypothetical protein
MTEHLSLHAGHRVRAGAGLDCVEVRATGRGLLLGVAGIRWVWGRWQGVVFRRFRTASAWALFVGLHGVAFIRAQLASAATLHPPRPPTPALPRAGARPPRVPDTFVAPRLSPPAVPGPFAVPQLDPTPPESA